MVRTFVMVKPDAVRRGLVGEILARFEKRGLKMIAMDMRVASKELAEAHYAEHATKPFFGELVTFLTSGPVVPFIVEGPKGTIEMVRLMLGATNPANAAPGTIRGDLAILMGENCCHASANEEDAERECKLWFPTA